MRKLLSALIAVPVLTLPCASGKAAPSAPVITETAHLAIAKGSGQYSGSIEVSSDKDNCRLLVLKPDLTKKKGSIGNVAIDRKAPGGMSNIQINSTVTTRGGSAYAELWVVDVSYLFKGKVCLPAKWWDPVATLLRLTYTPESGGSIAMLGGGLVSNTPVRVTGLAGLKVPSSADVIEVASDQADPLRFVLTPRGFRYEGGVGTVSTPSGKRYSHGEGR